MIRFPLPTRARPASAFTLVEVLVAIAVLSFMMLLLAQVAGMVNKASHDGMGRVDNFTKSRAMLDLIASDLQHAVIRPDLPIFQTGGTPNSFTIGGFTNGVYAPQLFTKVPGVSSNSVRNLSLVTYNIVVRPSSQGSDKIVLQRSDLPVPWVNGAATVPFQGDLQTNGAVARDMAPGVVGFQFSFRRADGTISTSYTGYDSTNAVVAVGITIAMVGDTVVQQLSPQQLTSIQEGFAAATPVSPTTIPGIKPLWDALLTPGFYSNYPKDMASNLKIFERWILPPQPF